MRTFTRNLPCDAVAVLAAMTLGLAARGQAATTSVPVNPIADAFVSSSHASSNYGGAGALSVSPSSNSKGEFDSLIRFDTTAARNLFDTTYGVGNWTIQSITLSLVSQAPGNTIFPGSDNPSGATNTSGAFTVEWMYFGSGWTEGSGTPAAPGSTGVTFSSQPASNDGLGHVDQLLGTPNFPGGNSGTNPYTLSSSSGLQASVADESSSTTSLNLRLSAAAGSNIAYTFGSRGGGGGGGGGGGAGGTSPPTLTLTAVPEPGVTSIAFALAPMAAASILVRRRRGA